MLQLVADAGADAGLKDEVSDTPSPAIPWAKPQAGSAAFLTPTIFHEPWWLNIVSRGSVEMVESKQHGRVVGRMPFTRQRRFGFATSSMPVLTHFLGPAIDAGQGSRNTRFLRKLAITRDLIEQLPDVAAFSQKFYHGIDDVIAFQMKGFETSVQFTHELAPATADELWRGMRDKTRNVARQAMKSYSIDDNPDIDEFIAMYKSNLVERNWRDGPDLTIVRQLIAGCYAHGQGRLLVARNLEGDAKAGILCVWDQTSCYYLLSTRALDSGNGAITLLLWHAIQQAAATGLIFDFDGFGFAGAVLFYAGFGAQIRPRYIVRKATTSYRLLREARRLIVAPDNPFT